MIKVTKRFVTLVLAVVLMTGLLSGCGGSGSSYNSGSGTGSLSGSGK
jgi:hypothetical protein